MSEDLYCSGCGEYAGSHINDRDAAQQAEIERLRRILKRVTPDPFWGEDPKATAYYKEARATLHPKEGNP